jgi:hypothetical protein
MPLKRVSIPTNMSGASPGALDDLIGRADPAAPEASPVSLAPVRAREAVSSQERETFVAQQDGKAVAALDGLIDESADDSSTREKITFYLRPDQVEKLDDLVTAYKRRTGQRTNRNALMRLLIDRVDIELILSNG